MYLSEDPAFTADYHDPEKRSIANSLTISLTDGATFTETVEYPLGHRRRRSEGIPLLEAKFRTNLARRFPAERQQAILQASLDQQILERMPVHEYVDLYAL
jgi:2-methylcitrate dehydratase